MITLRFSFGPRLPGHCVLVTMRVDGAPLLITTYKNARSYL